MTWPPAAWRAGAATAGLSSSGSSLTTCLPRRVSTSNQDNGRCMLRLVLRLAAGGRTRVAAARISSTALPAEDPIGCHGWHPDQALVSGDHRNTPSWIQLDLGRRWVHGSYFGCGAAADRRAAGRGRAGVAVASGDQPVSACDPAGGSGIAPPAEARTAAVAAEAVAGGAGRDLPRAGGWPVGAGDRRGFGPCPVDGVPGGGG